MKQHRYQQSSGELDGGEGIASTEEQCRDRERAYDAECFLVFDVCRMHGMTSLFIGSVHCRGSTAIMAVIKARP